MSKKAPKKKTFIAVGGIAANVLQGMIRSGLDANSCVAFSFSQNDIDTFSPELLKILVDPQVAVQLQGDPAFDWSQIDGIAPLTELAENLDGTVILANLSREKSPEKCMVEYFIQIAHKNKADIQVLAVMPFKFHTEWKTAQEKEQIRLKVRQMRRSTLGRIRNPQKSDIRLIEEILEAVKEDDKERFGSAMNKLKMLHPELEW